jgi:hypothetical protein
MDAVWNAHGSVYPIDAKRNATNPIRLSSLSTYLKLYGKHHAHCIREKATTTKVHSHENNKGDHGLKVTCVLQSPYIWSFACPGGTEPIVVSLRRYKWALCVHKHGPS